MIALLAVWSANLTGKFIHSRVLMAFNLFRPDSEKHTREKMSFVKHIRAIFSLSLKYLFLFLIRK